MNWHLRLAMVGLLIVCGVGGRFFRPHTKARSLPGIPAYDYQIGPKKQSTEAQSQTGILVEGKPVFADGKKPDWFKPGMIEPMIRPRFKYYQLSTAALQIDHCFVSQVAVTLHEDGLWTISCRADQNPVKTGTAADVGAFRPDNPGGVLSHHLKRNQFFLKVRCYGEIDIDIPLPNAAPGKPVLFHLDPPPFWVQNGQPYSFLAHGRSLDVVRFFDTIKRVDVEFSYR